MTDFTQDDTLAQQPFEFGEGPKPEAFIQWKGTDVCMDLHCDCGNVNHYDGYFAYVVVCGNCRQEWEMPWHLYPRKSQRVGSKPLEPNDD